MVPNQRNGMGAQGFYAPSFHPMASQRPIAERGNRADADATMRHDAARAERAGSRQRRGAGRQPSAGAAAMAKDHLIVFDRVTKVYDDDPEERNADRAALNEFSAVIDAGEFVYLIGHSGSGKSTLISMLTREIKPTTGRVIVAGENLNEMKARRVPYYRRNIGCVFQDFRLLDNKTAYENVAFALEVIGKKKDEIDKLVPAALSLVGLADKGNKFPNQLSGGERQRVSIARAVINHPPILICDEPTGNLDPENTLGIMALLEKLNQNGITILMATHDMDIVRKLPRRVIELSDGNLIRDERGGIRG